MVYTKILFGIGVSAAIFKIIIGVYMLGIMKQRMSHWIGGVSRSVKITMIATISVIIINFTVNHFNDFSESLWIFYIVPIESISTGTLVWKFSVTMLNSILETFLM